jgi:hypothetical protein
MRKPYSRRWTANMLVLVVFVLTVAAVAIYFVLRDSVASREPDQPVNRLIPQSASLLGLCQAIGSASSSGFFLFDLVKNYVDDHNDILLNSAIGWEQ